MTKKISKVLLLCSLSLLLTSNAFAAIGPMEQAKLTIDKVIEIIKSPDIDPNAKREQLSEAIRDRFNFKAMSQRVLARNWRKASPEEKDRFVHLFSELLERNYIGHIEGYTNEKVNYVKERIKKNKAAIDTVIATKSADIPVSYRMLQKKDGWKVYDVIIEEVSFVNNYRSTYGQILKKEGFTGLLAKMEQKLETLRQEN